MKGVTNQGEAGKGIERHSQRDNAPQAEHDDEPRRTCCKSGLRRSIAHSSKRLYINSQLDLQAHSRVALKPCVRVDVMAIIIAKRCIR